ANAVGGIRAVGRRRVAAAARNLHTHRVQRRNSDVEAYTPLGAADGEGGIHHRRPAGQVVGVARVALRGDFVRARVELGVERPGEIGGASCREGVLVVVGVVGLSGVEANVVGGVA